MAKTKKPTAKKGSRVTPRKDARKTNRELMKDAFKLYDKGNELIGRFEAGYEEISLREDVPAEVLEKMKAFLDKHKGAFGELITLQDDTAVSIEALLDNITLKWNDIELEVTAKHVEMQLRLEEWTAKFADLMGEAAELATELPDEAPTDVEKLSKLTAQAAAIAVHGRQSERGETVTHQVFDESPFVKEGESNEELNGVAPEVVSAETQEETVTQPVVERNGSVAVVDEDGNLKSLMA